jgi:hypothetical protein
MLQEAQMFDAQCDFAAVVYGQGDNPDRLLLDFAQDLRGSGVRIAGLVQLGWSGRRDRCELRALSNDTVVGISHHEGPGASGCRLDPEGLAGIARGIAAAIRDRVDLIVINRFGKLEAEGRGLIDLIRTAVDADIPVLIAVPEHRFAAWLGYSAGMSVRLPCRRSALDRWWQSVAGVLARAAPTVCAVAK